MAEPVEPTKAAGADLKPEAAAMRRLKLSAVILFALCITFSGASAWKLLGGSDRPVGSQAATPNPTSEKPEAEAAAQTPSNPGQAVERKRLEGNLFAKQKGVTASGCVNAEVLIDGNSTQFDGGSGYAHYDLGDPNGRMQVDLDTPQVMTRVSFLLWDQDARTYRYKLDISADGAKWKTVLDSSNADQRSWQEARFPPQPVRAVRLMGVANSSNSGFHVVELEARQRRQLRQRGRTGLSHGWPPPSWPRAPARCAPPPSAR